MLISRSRRPNIYFNITSPTPGTFIIALHYKGREKAILEMDLKIDDLLEKVIIHTQDPSRNQLLNFLLTAKRQQTPPGPGIRSVERSKGLRPSQKGLRQTIIPFTILSLSRIWSFPESYAFLRSSQSSVLLPPFGCIILCSYVWRSVVLSFLLFLPV